MLARWPPAARGRLGTVSAHHRATGELKSARRSKNVVAKTSSQYSFLTWAPLVRLLPRFGRSDIDVVARS